MHRKQFFFPRRGRGGSRLYSAVIIISVLILASSLLAASQSMWTSRLRINSAVKTGFFKADICRYRVSVTHHCGCPDVTVSLEDNNETLRIMLGPEDHHGNATVCILMVIRNNASIPVALDGIEVETSLAHGGILAHYYGAFNASTACGGLCRVRCSPPPRLEAGVPMRLEPGEASIIAASIQDVEAGSGGVLLVHVASHPAG